MSAPVAIELELIECCDGVQRDVLHVFCSETLESLRQLVDINAATIRNREEAERIGLADRETDSRTRSTCRARAHWHAFSSDRSTRL